MQPTFTYQTGGALKRDYQGYVERPADTELFDSLRAGEFCYVLTARQMGKSSLKVRTIQKLRDIGWQCVDVDITSFGSRDATAEQWYFSFLSDIANVLDFGDAFEDWWEDKRRFTPVKRFSQFWTELLCTRTKGEIIIFMDEIDSMLSLDKAKFSTDDFFAALRSVYNDQADNQELRRIHFCILGVAAPNDLMDDPARTPFNVGKAIPLGNLQIQDIQPLVEGLEGYQVPAHNILKETLQWSGGQPYLTQKLCEALSKQAEIKDAQEAVQEAVQFLFLSPGKLNEEANLSNVKRRVEADAPYQTAILSAYNKILKEGHLKLDLRKTEQIYLKLTGLVREEDSQLILNNAIYGEVFGLGWWQGIWESLERPFESELRNWQKSNQNPDFLLRGEALQQHIQWANGREDVTPEERAFLETSRKAETDRIERQQKRLRMGLIVAGFMVAMTVGFAIFAYNQKGKAEELRNIALGKERIADSLFSIADSLREELAGENTQLIETNNRLTVAEQELQIALDTTKDARKREELQRIQALFQKGKAEEFADSLNKIREALRINNFAEQLKETNPSLAMRLSEY
ncbi:MAG: AAA-like domain-containing protein, partial [Bacteroidota bacterium]